jgi:predicted transcriptional regulator
MEEEENNDLPLPSELFMELASESRFSILTRLKENPSKLSTLSRIQGTSVQDVFRNMNRLTKEGLVKKDLDGLFALTEYGIMVLNQIPYFVFLKRHRKFFEQHSLKKSTIPNKFLRRIGELERCEVVESVTLVFQRLKKLESSAKNTLKLLVSQAWPEEGLIFVELARQGVKIMTIAGHNMIIPKSIVTDIGPMLDKLISDGMFEAMMSDEARVALYIADGNEAGIMFPDIQGEVDMTTLFVSKDTEFCGWCSDLFDHYRSMSKKFDLNKMKVRE